MRIRKRRTARLLSLVGVGLCFLASAVGLEMGKEYKLIYMPVAALGFALLGIGFVLHMSGFGDEQD